MVLVAALWWTLRRRTRSVADRCASALDERDLASRNAAAWWGLTAALTAGCASALALLVAARVQTLDARVLLDRSGSEVPGPDDRRRRPPTMVLAATSDPDHNDDDR